MKLTIATFTMLFTFIGLAQADEFYMTQNGRNYLCQSTDDNSNPSSDISACVQKAYAGPFSKDEAFQLCTGAYGTGPADCAIALYAGPFSKDDSMSACTGRDSRTSDCMLKAYAGPYSKEEAIRMCIGGSPELVSRSLTLIQSSSELRAKVKQMKLQKLKLK